MVKLSIIFSFLVLSFFQINGQFQKTLFDNYTLANGLPAFNITKIIQDRYGFIWLTSQQGIHCFDGKNYFTITYDYRDPDAFRQSHIRDMYLDGDSLWVAISYGGVSIIDVKKRKVVGSLGCSPDKFVPCKFSNWILSIDESKNHEMWLGGYEGIFIVSKKAELLQTIDINPFTGEKEDFTSRCIAVDNKNRIWVGIDGRGIAVYDGTSRKLIKTIEQKNWLNPRGGSVIKKILADPEKGILISTDAGAFLIKNDDRFEVRELIFKPDPANRNIISKNFNSISKLPGNRYWFATFQGCFRTDENFTIKEFYSTANSNLADDIVFNHFIDKDGLVWIACYKGISLLNENRKAFTIYRYANKEMQDKGQFLNTYAVNDSLLISATLHGMFTLNLRSGLLKRIPGSNNDDIEFFALEKLPDGRIFTSSGKGIYLIERIGDFFRFIPAEKIYSELAPFSKEVIISALGVNDSIVVMGSQNESGIFVWNLQSKKIVVYKRVSGNHNTPADNNVNHISKDTEGNVWIESDMALMKLDWQNGKFTNYFAGNKKIPFNSTIVYDLYDDGDYYWIATYSGGISRVNKKTGLANFITTNEGLCNNCVFSLTPVKNYLWATTDRGISRINMQTLQIKNFYAENGLHANYFDDRSVSQFDPFIYFSGLTGLTRVDTRLLKNNTEKPVTYITGIAYNQNGSFKHIPGINPEKIKLPPKTSTISISLSAICFPEGGHTKFLYRIPEFNSSWINQGENNLVTLAGLTHGTYKLEVKSISAEGVESEKTTELSITILPAWYQTILFKLLVIIASFFALFLLLRYYYLYELKKKQAIIEKQLALQFERQRISSDLHDEIGSTLSSVNIYAGLARQEPLNPVYIEVINQNVTEVVNKLDDLVWSIKPTQDSLTNIAERLTEFAASAARIKGIAFKLSLDPQLKDQQLLPDIKHHLYMVTKELINNAIKHSGCKQISVEFKKSEDQLIVIVKDNGYGFKVETVRNDRNGLKNIRERANAMKANLVIDSVADKGTEVKINIPARVL